MPKKNRWETNDTSYNTPQDVFITNEVYSTINQFNYHSLQIWFDRNNALVVMFYNPIYSNRILPMETPLTSTLFLNNNKTRIEMNAPGLVIAKNHREYVLEGKKNWYSKKFEIRIITKKNGQFIKIIMDPYIGELIRNTQPVH